MGFFCLFFALRAQVVSSETHGLPSEWAESCTKMVTIPMPGKTESLNAAVAGSIALYLMFGK